MSPYFIEKFKLLLKILGLCVFSWLCGLLIFISKIPDSHESSAEVTDATVILTGGSLRVEEGVRVGTNQLLISGIGPGVTKADLNRAIKDSDLTIPDEVILGNIANSTFTNAYETKIFMDLHRYKSMRLVTSNYHMPRTQLIFSYVMPNYKILYHPVYSDNFRKDGNYISIPSFVMITSEYNKFLGAFAIISYEVSSDYWDRAWLSVANWIRG